MFIFDDDKDQGTDDKVLEETPIMTFQIKGNFPRGLLPNYIIALCNFFYLFFVELSRCHECDKNVSVKIFLKIVKIIPVKAQITPLNLV